MSEEEISCQKLLAEAVKNRKRFPDVNYIYKKKRQTLDLTQKAIEFDGNENYLPRAKQEEDLAEQQ